MKKHEAPTEQINEITLEVMKNLITKSCDAVINENLYPENLIIEVTKYKTELSDVNIGNLLDTVKKLNYKNKEKLYVEYHSTVVCKLVEYFHSLEYLVQLFVESLENT